MFSEFLQGLSAWESLDTSIAMIGVLAGMACALPGTWLILRRQSMLGDALSHAVLPGIVIAYLGVTWLEHSGYLTSAAAVSSASDPARVAEGMSIVVRRQMVLFLGAGVSAVFAAVVSDLIQRWGRVERSAALGVVFTSMFALGLLLVRLLADRAHLDAGCVLYGNLEANAATYLPGTHLPQAAIVNGGMLLLNGLLVIAFFKELKLSTFDPGLAQAFGMRASWVSLAVMSATAATVVAAFESVGAILVIAMMIVPGATARLLTDRLGTMLVLSLVIAAVGAVVGHLLAITLPPIVCPRLGFAEVQDVGTAGMIAATSGGLFVLAILASPRHGVLRVVVDRMRLRVRIIREDLLGRLYRRMEATKAGRAIAEHERAIPAAATLKWFARRELIARGLIVAGPTEDALTSAGEAAARSLVRSHRLWEAYMARHFDLPDDHLHATAEQVEHFLSPDIQAELAAELNEPATDPHGKSIPSNGT